MFRQYQDQPSEENEFFEEFNLYIENNSAIIFGHRWILVLLQMDDNCYSKKL